MLLKREAGLAEYFSAPEYAFVEDGTADFAIITAGPCYNYVKEAAPDAPILKLISSYPLATKAVEDFCKKHKTVFVVEELELVIEEQILRLGLKVEGKKYFSRVGEFSTESIRESLAAAGVMPPPVKSLQDLGLDVDPLVRPPVLCSGCPHTAAYMAVRAMEGRVAGDIGCYTLAAVDPLRSIDTTVAMGSSIGNAIGMFKAGEEKPVMATIGDSTFLHSGIPPLIDAVYNNANITVLLLDNHITAMTGGQDHPGTGKTLRGDVTSKVEYEDICRAVGVKWVRTADSYDMGTLYHQLREAIAFKGVSVLILNRPCVLDPVKIKGPSLIIDEKGCVGCQSCMNLGCPALSWSGKQTPDGMNQIKIEPDLCIGCSLCAQVCPSDCIQPTVTQ
jgi:indolepyruvate ferredoxin oxidoreductase alpha subunit